MSKYKRNISVLAIFTSFAFFNIYCTISNIYLKNNKSTPDNNYNIVLHNEYKSYEPPHLNKMYLIKRAGVKPLSRSASYSSQTSSMSYIWPVNGILSSGYGMRGSSFHKGIDIAAPSGTHIYAFADGIVKFSGWDNGGYGNLIIISHNNEFETYYAHNSKLLVEKKQQIKKGQLIAILGSTGDSDGPHCHFEIRKNKIPIDPLTLLK